MCAQLARISRVALRLSGSTALVGLTLLASSPLVRTSRLFAVQVPRPRQVAFEVRDTASQFDEPSALSSASPPSNAGAGDPKKGGDGLWEELKQRAKAVGEYRHFLYSCMAILTTLGFVLNLFVCSLTKDLATNHEIEKLELATKREIEKLAGGQSKLERDVNRLARDVNVLQNTAALVLKQVEGLTADLRIALAGISAKAQVAQEAHPESDNYC